MVKYDLSFQNNRENKQIRKIKVNREKRNQLLEALKHA